MTQPLEPRRTELDRASEYGRLLAQRDRLISDGADPDELAVPLPPVVYPDRSHLELAVPEPEPPDTGYRRTGCSIIPWLAAFAFWAALGAVFVWWRT